MLIRFLPCLICYLAIHGYPFCEAAHEAFGLLSSNILRLSAINSVGDFILFLGKVAVVAASVIFGLEMQQVCTRSLL